MIPWKQPSIGSPFLSLDSFLCTSEFLVLGAFNHVQAPHPDLAPQVTRSNNANEAAQFRVGASLRTTRKLNLGTTECKNFLEIACVRHIQEEVETEVKE
ncbi:hypothetical protein BGZ67_000513, partial [Mortierella alpina]